MPNACVTGSPSRVYRAGAPSSRPNDPAFSHAVGLPREHGTQRPHDGTTHATTWSPTLTIVASGPTSVTTPAISWPSISGSGMP